MKYAVTVIISISVITGLASTVSARQKVTDTFYIASVRYYNGRDFPRALEFANLAIQSDPNNSWAFHARSSTYLALGDFDNALADANNAVRLDGKNARLIAGRAWVFYKQHEWSRMYADADLCIKLGAGEPYYFETRAVALCALRKFDQSLEDVEKSLRLNDHYSRAYDLRGHIHGYHRRFKDAIADYQKALKCDPENSHALTDYAWLLATCEDTQIRDGQKALEFAKTACEKTDWKDWYCISALAAGFAETGDFDRAVKYEEMAQKMCHDESALSLGRESLRGYRQLQPRRGNSFSDP